MPDDKWHSSISNIRKGEIRVRGYDVTELMGNKSFAEAIFLLLKGELPTAAEAKMFDAILTSSIDHGVTPPSVLGARTVASGGNPLNAAVAGGVLVIGDTHGGAIEQCAKILQEWAQKEGEVGKLAAHLVEEFASKNKRLPGYGHRLHDVDPRTIRLFQIAKQLNFSGRHIELAVSIQEYLAEVKRKSLPINVDGAIAAVISDMGFDWRLGKGFFIISRVPGLVAHIFEELTREKPMRQLGNTNWEYDGPKPRDIS
ncbi:MAG: citryl-CoA lyase [candidate division Zixibacteria bacterium CG_4_9_14_3_um_filter_46_8]|nr:MAG: citryl-CoA lyase [candidate division Zixibacteria bacterium CG_4_9_14_3_um_filter_46_8]